jgi:hypothetical protein
MALNPVVFTQDVLDMWAEYKTANEIDPVRLRPASAGVFPVE